MFLTFKKEEKNDDKNTSGNTQQDAPGSNTVTPVTPPASSATAINLGLKAAPKGSGITANWVRVKGAGGYKVYGAYSGKKLKLLKKINSGKITKLTITKLNGKKIDPKKSYVIYITAYRNAGRKQIQIAKSLKVYVYAINGYSAKIKVLVR